MKLLQINSVVNTGSTGRIAESIGEMVISQGWESYIAYGRSAEKSRSKLIKIGSSNDKFYHGILSRLFDRHGLGSKKATKQFLQQIDTIKPDVIHIHNLHGYYIHLPLIINYIKAKKIPTVITMHDFWYMTGHCAYINKSCEKWKVHCGKCMRSKEYPASLTDRSYLNWNLKKQLFSNADMITFVPVSHYLYGFATQSLLKTCNFQVIYNGIDVESFKPSKKSEYTLRDIDWTKFTILTVATRWTLANGYNEVIALSKKLPKDCQIIMVGVNNSQLKSLPTNIIGIKRTENVNQLKELYTRSNVTFNPNTEVTFGLVTVESLACGTPVIVLKATAGEELIKPEIGFIVENSIDIIPLIPRIKGLANTRISTMCRNHVIAQFNNQTQLKKYFHLYHRIISDSK